MFILDDDPDFRGDLAEFLADAGCDVVSAGDARAVSTDDLCACDVLILDLSMPGCDGVSVLKQVSACDRMPGVVVISGQTEDIIQSVTDAGRLRHIPILGSLHKPFDPDDLLRILRSVAPAVAASAAPTPIPTLLVVAALRNALNAVTEDLPFPMTFQPKVDARTLRFAGAESLLPNSLPGLGPISPTAVVEAAATEAGLLEQLAHETFRSAVAACRCWMDAGYKGTVSVNIALEAVLAPEAAAVFSRLARAAGIAPSSVICELTEDALYTSNSDSLSALAQMRIAGFGLAMDDIGQRQSGLLQLARLPVTELKIDRELIVQARQSDKARSIVASLVALGTELSMKVVAEGIETSDDLALVRSSGVDYVQGYLIARKMPLADLLGWLRASTLGPSGAIIAA